ncbi:MAG: hypothetical protein K8I00_07340 [Candidatus Omnitrophica bacterium]|nr:hypothetical protein [Candidatus Omnitrophota bacterium]
MKLTTIKLVTIIAPKYLKEAIVNLLKSTGIRGFTYYYVFGAGERQINGFEEDDVENVKFRVLVPKLLALTLMKVVSEEYFDKEKVIAFEQDANVIRSSKFGQVDNENG